MIDKHINSPKSIKYYIKKFIYDNQSKLKDKVVVDIPAGNGSTAEMLVDVGAKVKAFDLFPEYFMLDSLECQRADIIQGIPMDDESADYAICQEGIEHFSDQIKVFKECNRILKKGGKLIITTPSYSSLAAKMSYLMYESETPKKMPPNELDDIWMSDKSITNEIYHGHIFLVGLQKLRVLGRLSGFKISELRMTMVSKKSVFLLPFFYPFILLRSYLIYSKRMKKNKSVSKEYKRSIYQEQLRINTSIKNLINKHTFIIFEKEKQHQDVDFRQDEVVRSFDKTM